MWHIVVKFLIKATLCEYEVNLSTNEKVITEKHFFNTMSSEGLTGCTPACPDGFTNI